MPTPALSDSPVAAAGAARTSTALSLAVLAGAHLAVDCFTAVWPVYKTVAALDLVRAGLIATVASMMANGLQVVFGVIADRGGAKTLLIIGVLGAGAVALLPYVSSYPAMFALVATTATCSAAFHPTGTGAAGALTQHRTGVFVALFLVGGYLGYASSQLVFTSVYRLTGGGTAVLLPVSIAAALLVARLVPRSTVPAPQSLAAWGRSVRVVARRLWPLFAIQVFAGAATMSVVFLLPDLLKTRGAPPWMVEGGGHLAYVCGACLALVPAGHLSDRLGARRVLVVTNLVSGALLLLGLREGLGPTSVLLLVAAFGALNGCNPVIAIAEGNRVMPGQSSGASALLMGLPACLSALAPVIAGMLAAPGRGGTPAGALRWMTLCVPTAFLFCLLLPRQEAPLPGPSATR